MSPGGGPYLGRHIAQVEGIFQGFLAPLMIGCGGQVASVKATPLVVGAGRSVEDVHAANGRRDGRHSADDIIRQTEHAEVSHLSSSLKSQNFLSAGPLREAGFSRSITQEAVRVRGS